MKLSRNRLRPERAGGPARLLVRGLLLAARARAAGRTCTTSRRTSRCATASSSATPRARGRSSRARSRAARCRTTRCSSPARNGGADVDALPFALTAEVLDRGEQRFNIYCTPCHGRTGSGDGMIVQRGYRQPPSFHIDRLRAGAAGTLLRRDDERLRRDAGLSGAGPPRDRWAIAAYVRALQLSQHAAVADVPPEDRPKLSQPASRAGGRRAQALMQTHALTTVDPAGHRPPAAARPDRRRSPAWRSARRRCSCGPTSSCRHG